MKCLVNYIHYISITGSNLNYDSKDWESLTPDDDVFRFLAKQYADLHPTMHNGLSCEEDYLKFKDGITNGAAWYQIIGRYIFKTLSLMYSNYDKELLFHVCMDHVVYYIIMYVIYINNITTVLLIIH